MSLRGKFVIERIQALIIPGMFGYYDLKQTVLCAFFYHIDRAIFFYGMCLYNPFTFRADTLCVFNYCAHFFKKNWEACQTSFLFVLVLTMGQGNDNLAFHSYLPKKYFPLCSHLGIHLYKNNCCTPAVIA